MRPSASPAPRPPRPQPPIPRPAAQHPLPCMPPRPQHLTTRRTAKQPADQLSLHERHLGAYDQHRVPPPASKRALPTPTKLTGGLSRVQKRAKPANPAGVMPPMNSTTAPARAGFKRRSTPGRSRGLSEELCRHERKRSPCLQRRETGPHRAAGACWSATRGLRAWSLGSRRGCPATIAASGSERGSALGNPGAARPPGTPGRLGRAGR